jgi:hypothetical protein
LETFLTRRLAIFPAKLWTALIVVALAGNGARAQGFRFGYGGPNFAGPRFDGPRYGGPSYDGPRYGGPGHFDVEEAPPPDAPPPDGRPPGPRTCYTAAAARERVAEMKLHEPFALMREASAFAHAEALAGKLCRWNDLDVYEITLLRPDGRVIHVFMNAANGQLVGALNAR